MYTFNILFTQILDQHAPLKTVQLQTWPTPFLRGQYRSPNENKKPLAKASKASK